MNDTKDIVNNYDISVCKVRMIPGSGSENTYFLREGDHLDIKSMQMSVLFRGDFIDLNRLKKYQRRGFTPYKVIISSDEKSTLEFFSDKVVTGYIEDLNIKKHIESNIDNKFEQNSRSDKRIKIEE